MAPDRPFHVMQVVYSLAHGGSERLACNLARAVRSSRIRTSVCATTHGGPLAATLAAEGIPSHVIGRRPGIDARVAVELFRLFRRERVDVVQTHHLGQLFYSVMGARLNGAALIHVEHDRFSLAGPRAGRMLRALAPFCRRVVAVGDELREFLVRDLGLSDRRTTVIRNGVDPDQYSPVVRRTREALGLPLDGRLIGHVARLSEEKDQGALLRAFSGVLRSYPDARLVLVGDGPCRTELEQIARTLGIGARVHFLGARGDVDEILPHLDMFVFCSVREGLPLAVLEAMACARPVVATAVGDVPGIVQHQITGLTLAPGDAGALGACMETMLADPEGARAMGHAARRLVAERYGFAATVARYRELYDSVLASRGRHPTAATSRA